MTLEPKGENVLLEIITRADQFAAAAQKTSGLIVTTTQTKQAEPNMGRVYAIGTEVSKDREYKVGDVVIFHTKEIFQGFKFEGKSLVSVLHDEIVAIVLENSV